MKEIVDNYEQRGIPLDVLVTDMDWHITFYKEASEGKKDLAGQTIGWTGFTWDKHLFPDPKMFLDWYVCTDMCVYVSLYGNLCVSMYVSMYVSVYGSLYVCKPVC